MADHPDDVEFPAPYDPASHRIYVDVAVGQDLVLGAVINAGLGQSYVSAHAIRELRRVTQQEYEGDDLLLRELRIYSKHVADLDVRVRGSITRRYGADLVLGFDFLRKYRFIEYETVLGIMILKDLLQHWETPAL